MVERGQLRVLPIECFIVELCSLVSHCHLGQVLHLILLVDVEENLLDLRLSLLLQLLQGFRAFILVYTLRIH